MNKNQEVGVTDRILRSIDRLYIRYGIRPTHLLLSRDIIELIIETLLLQCRFDSEGVREMYLYGLKVKQIAGNDIIEAAVLLESESNE